MEKLGFHVKFLNKVVAVAYRVLRQGSQHLGQVVVHLLCRSLKEFPTTTHKQCVS